MVCDRVSPGSILEQGAERADLFPAQAWSTLAAMCLIGFAFQTHPVYTLVIAANRDEFFSRPTAFSSWWQHPPMLAGQDLQAGGTWLGTDRSGRIAALTNFRDPRRTRQDRRSRGELPVGFLANTQTAEQYIGALRPKAREYNDFNLLLGDQTGLWCYESRVDLLSQITPGIHAISNGPLDAHWPKMEKLKTGMKQALDSDQALFALLADPQTAPLNELPDTGIGQEWELLLSSSFISSPLYGTRASTLLTMNKSGHIRWTERSFSQQGLIQTIHHEFMQEPA